MLALTDKIRRLAAEAERELRPVFEGIDTTAAKCSERVLAAFRNCRVSESEFAGTTGYGYDDHGRETLEKVYAEVFEAESALVRISIANGTHAIACALYAACEPGKVLLAAVGAPYDTLHGVIGIGEERPLPGSLAWYGVGYRDVPYTAEGGPDVPAILEAVAAPEVGAVLIQRSRGYASRRTLSADEIDDLIRRIKAVRPEINIVVDNCYGEFADDHEPHGDLVCGSLIKNPGGGLAPCGGYVVGRGDLVERAAFRLTVPGLGGEVGATLGQSRLLFEGLFLASHTVAQAKKTMAFAAKLFEKMGYAVSPKAEEPRHDVIQTVELCTPEALIAFCRGIQSGSAVDSFVVPEAWPMPGYDCDVIMAAGAFVQGSSIELSCDAPMREPYRVYLQGGLTYESGKLAVMLAADQIQ